MWAIKQRRRIYYSAAQWAERLKHRYFHWLRNAKRMADKSVEQVAMALDRFEEFTIWRDLRLLRVEQAEPFKKHLAKLNGQRSGERLSKATINSTLYAMRDFVCWLADQRGFRRGWCGPMPTTSTHRGTTKPSHAVQGR